MKPIYVEWIDCAQLDGWSEIPKGFEPCRIKTLGWLVSETDDALTVAGSIEDGDKTMHGVLCIPKFAIKKRKNASV